MKYWIGIDPGADGALAWINDTGKTGVIPFSEFGYLSELVYVSAFPAKAVVEKVGARPGQGVKSMFSFGQNFGFILGILQAYSIPYELVPPQKWKREFSITADKNQSIRIAKHLYPNVDLKKSDRCRKDHDGMAEALLMAEFARRHMK